MDNPNASPEFDPVPFYIGFCEPCCGEVVTEEVFHHAEDLGYDFLATPITNNYYRMRVLEEVRNASVQDVERRNPALPAFSQLSPLQGGETNVSPNEVSSKAVYIIDDWIDLACDDPVVADFSKQVLLQEVNYAGFCGATNVVVHGPRFLSRNHRRQQVLTYADAIREAQASSPSVSISILLPLALEDLDNEDSPWKHKSVIWHIRHKDVSDYPRRQLMLDDLSIWDVWHSIQAACKYDNRVSIALIIPKKLPPSFVLDRWLSEPIRLLELPFSSFTPNQRNVDVLTKPHQDFLARALRGKVAPWILLRELDGLPGVEYNRGGEEGSALHSDFGSRPSPAEISFAQLTPQQTSPHLMYLREHLQRKQPVRSTLEKYGAGYQDWPQSPLQPLADNLDSVTYEVFEKDPVKYAWYECAVKSALEDFASQGWLRGGRNGNAVVVAVVGAGRGPLMQRVLQASKSTGVEVEAWALEKNPSAFVHLQKRNALEWNSEIHLVQSDMRSWSGPTDSEGNRIGVNILVSELLGSLADNELSPECLDGVQHLLHPTHGISIPSSYSAFATPVAAQELWRAIKYRVSPATSNSKITDPMQLPYVSWLHTFDYLATAPHNSEAQDNSAQQYDRGSTKDIKRPSIANLWSFHHPDVAHKSNSTAAKSNHHNIRTAHHTFRLPHRGVCHGIAGYFEAVLYDRASTIKQLKSHSTEATDETVHPPPSDQPWPSDPSHVVLSLNPLTMPIASPDMISWFPLFFPFKTPVYVPNDAEMELSIWRKTDDRGVWYEWCAEVFGKDGVKTGESGWHSSEGAPCLM
ncbi:MAG: hypothetical protein Q9159_000739 [Coniocarpon cinnabarinum]